MQQLRGHTTGFAIPTYVLDTPYGKVPLNRSWVQGRAGDYVVMNTYDGTVWAEPNPLSASHPHAGVLPRIPYPDHAKTVPSTAETPIVA